jgi:hypothetical protein
MLCQRLILLPGTVALLLAGPAVAQQASSTATLPVMGSAQTNSPATSDNAWRDSRNADTGSPANEWSWSTSPNSNEAPNNQSVDPTRENYLKAHPGNRLR